MQLCYVLRSQNARSKSGLAMVFKHVCLEAFGYELPPNVLTSAEIELRLKALYDRLKLPEGRLQLMSGIRERRIWNPETRPSETSTLAGRKALENSGVSPGEIECLLHTSVSRDYMEPASASFVHRALGLSPDAIIYDISNACLGFLNGMMTLAGMIELGQVKRGLIVAGESSRQLLETTIDTLLKDTTSTRDSIKGAFASLTIGSGACALVMAHDSVSRFKHRFLGGAIRCATEWSDLCRGNYSGMNTDSEKLLHEGCRLARSTWEKARNLLGWENENVDRTFCHQVGSAHRKLLFQSLGLDLSRDFSTFETLGNTGSVALPMTMAMGLEQNPPPPDTNIAMLGIGSGLNCLMLGVKW
jgi:acyl-CoA:acyl-CoA alkyltransferase